ncbi:hypothetical protein SAMN02927921_00609 [Sinomicrobium oceani]|uniref:Uncharacterized protein n=1 Tax=Sinomicrobium oceani TaxID=1150368 RepID=A0A1K1MEE7_9FLAO|nr:hypothetical protein [Sinomicrobium oceani]SFW21481.1 hypothetical protein SAMN02927921_00609 [Sinomicrobium oceani]
MKNKRNTYILLLAVLAIWGLIGYKILQTINPAQETTEQAAAKVSFHPEKVKKQLRFDITVHERDPFLGTLYKPVKKAVTQPVPQKKAVPEIEIPVSYYGMVKDDRSREKIYFVQIDGVQQLMRVGDEINHIKLVKGDRGTITIEHNRKRRTIRVTGQN